ncbi:MAG: YIP1 family protein [Candidatus Eisenbacteria bacterium]
MTTRTESPDAGLLPPTRPSHFGPPDALRTIWTRPRATVRWLLDHGDRGLWVAFVVVEVASITLLRLAVAPPSSGRLSRDLLDLSVLLVVPALAFLAWTFMSTWIGRSLGGRAHARDVAFALAWGLVPVAASVPLLVLGAIAQSNGRVTSGRIAAAVALGLWTWGVVLAIRAVAEAHRFPVVRAGVTLWAGFMLGMITLGWVLFGVLLLVGRALT